MISQYAFFLQGWKVEGVLFEFINGGFKLLFRACIELFWPNLFQNDIFLYRFLEFT